MDTQFTTHRSQRKDSRQRFPLGKSCVQSLGTERVLLMDLLPQISMVNSDVAFPTKLQLVIQNKQHGMLTWDIMVIHDSAC